jgi:hypothetical protein
VVSLPPSGDWLVLITLTHALFLVAAAAIESGTSDY